MTARPLGWGAADVPDGTRYKVSPVGLSHVLHPDQPVSVTRDCWWSPPAGDVALCAAAPGGSVAFRLLRLVPLLLDVAVALCLGSMVLLAPRSPRLDRLAPLIMAAAMIATLGAPLLFGLSAPRALAALQGLGFGVGGTRGILQISTTAALLAGLAAALLLPAGSSERARRLPRWAGIATLVLLPALAFLSMFPAAGGLAFAAASTGVGIGAGVWLRRETRAPSPRRPMIRRPMIY